DAGGGEIGHAEIWRLFNATYLTDAGPLRYLGHRLAEIDGGQRIELDLQWHGATRCVAGDGNGPLDAAVAALTELDCAVTIRSYEERSLGPSRHGGDARACAFVELAGPDGQPPRYGVGIDNNLLTASIKALISGVNRSAE
ncbi:alpha-isopropylmalate synthase regulatory domain-containing protein, partial [Methylomonas koyamae]|uniref:alpha-isopropylmalate synthase regulatory domain-containing protein n=1 Tax=Methylomonas koyamae TaxID=702114 RepID=UPI0028C44F67